MGKKKKGGKSKDTKGKKEKKPRKPSKKWESYKIEGSSVTKKAFCPRCGPGVFLAEHKNRSSCGRCGYTTFKRS